MLKPMYIYKVTQDSFLEQEFEGEVGLYRDSNDAIKAARKRAEFLASDENNHKLSTGNFKILDNTEIDGCYTVKDEHGEDRYEIYVTSVEVY